MPEPSESGPAPTEIRLHQKSCLMEIAFADGQSFKLPYEFLRVYSPSAEVRGHATGIYSWEYLHHLGENQERLWAEYLARMEQAGASRD